MQTENQIERDQAPANANADAQQAPGAQEQKYKEAQRVVSMAFDADGAAHGSKEQAKNLSQLLKVRPDLRSEIIAILHETPGLGNAFVYMVLHPGDNKGYAMGLASENNAHEKGTASPAPAESKPQAAAAEAANASTPAKSPGNDELALKQGHSFPMSEDTRKMVEENNAGPNSAADTGAKPQVAAATQGPAPAPASAETKNEEPAPTQPKDAAAPAKNEVAPAGQNDAASKAEDKAAIEKGKDEKPEEKAEGTVKITASALRVRAEPSLNGKILGKIMRGETAKAIGREGAWLKIEWANGATAYIHSKYTTAVKGNESGEEEEEQGEHQSQETKQERPKNTTPKNDDEQKVLV